MIFWVIFLSLLLTFYLLDRHLMSYWANRGFPQDNPKFFIGNFGGFLQGKSFTEYFEEAYNKYKNHPVMGLYLFYQKALLINDPELIQDVLIKDFNNFHDRPFIVDEKTNPLSSHLFSIRGQRWRDLRAKLSPTFTSGKLKGMYPTIRECSKTFEKYLEKNVREGKNEFDFRDLFARYTTNIISSVAFGVENDSINEPDNIFRQTGLKIFESTFKSTIVRFIFFMAPQLIPLLRIKTFGDGVENFFMNLVRQTIDYREKNNYERNDFMQMLIQLKNQGYVSVDKNEEKDQEQKPFDHKKLLFNDVAANSFLFFVAGFETSSSTMNFCLIELCKNPKVQKKVHDELDKFIEDGEITYETLSSLKYLECCIDETLRIHSIVPSLSRECTKDYKIRNTNLVIEKGTQIIFPVYGLHKDPKIYENPTEFRPERFLKSTSGSEKVKGTFYLPFGDGQRNCIGARMGKLQAKLGLAVSLSNFSFELVDKSLMDKEIELDRKQFIATPKGVLMRAQLRK